MFCAGYCGTRMAYTSANHAESIDAEDVRRLERICRPRDLELEGRDVRRVEGVGRAGAAPIVLHHVAEHQLAGLGRRGHAVGRTVYGAFGRRAQPVPLRVHVLDPELKREGERAVGLPCDAIDAERGCIPRTL